jgi:nucleoside-diphosphate-sugar epimerase
LGPWLAELSLREFARERKVSAVCLRFGSLVGDEEAASQPFDPRWLHIEDAVQGIEKALHFESESGEIHPGWRVFHIASGSEAKVPLGSAGRERFGYQPRHTFEEQRARSNPSTPLYTQDDWKNVLAPRQPIPSRPIRNVVIFGAGGPLASVTTHHLQNSYRLRLTDIRPLAEIAKTDPQGPNAPHPVSPSSPHEERIVDVTDPAAVMAACEGMDAILNCSVIREGVPGAFRVNSLGAYNIMKAAVAHRIRRVVHTGPQLIDTTHPASYDWDFEIAADAPVRSGEGLYSHTKLLGQEICRVFAEEYGLEVPVMLFTSFQNPETMRDGWVHPFTISWNDSALAMRRALEVGSLPSPYEVFNILADLPHGRYTNQKVKLLLDWEPHDNFERIWMKKRD